MRIFGKYSSSALNFLRFLDQFSKLSDFYNKCRNLQYFKYLVQVPSLPDTPPNFLIAAELSQHVTPVAVVPDVVDDLVDDAASTDSAVPLVDQRERYIDQLLAEIESLQVRLENCSHSFPSLELEQTFHFLSIV